MFLQKTIFILFDETLNQWFLYLDQRAEFLMAYKEFLHEHTISDHLRICYVQIWKS